MHSSKLLIDCLLRTAGTSHASTALSPPFQRSPKVYFLTYNILDKIIAEYKAIGPVLNRKDKSKASILSIIDQTSSRLGLKASMKRLTPDGKDKVRIRMEQAGFDKVMSWLAMLSKEHQINTEALSLRPNEDDQGVVSGNLTLHRW